MTTTTLIAALYGLGLFAWLLWPALSAVPAAVRRWLSGGGEPEPRQVTWRVTTPQEIDLADLAALQKVEARFKRLNCEAGLAACQTLYANFFHRGGPEA